jgi:hypothetical protein
MFENVLEFKVFPISQKNGRHIIPDLNAQNKPNKKGRAP